MVAMLPEQTESIELAQTPETEAPEVLRQLEAAAAFQGPWRDTYLLMMPQSLKDLVPLTAATHRAIEEGKIDHARFFIEQTKLCATKLQAPLERIKTNAQVATDYRRIGDEYSAKKAQVWSQDHLSTLFQKSRMDSPKLTDIELIDKNRDLQQAIDLVVTIQAVNYDLAAAEKWLVKIDQTHEATDSLFRIFLKILPYSPDLAQNILKKLRAHCQNRTIPPFVNNVFGIDEGLQSGLGPNLIRAAEKIERDELVFIVTTLLHSGYHIDQLDRLIPYLETLGADTDQLIQDFVDAHWTDPGAASIEFFRYVGQKKDISLMMEFFPKNFPTEEHISSAARAFLDKYTTAEAAIHALTAYETERNFVAISKVIWEIVSIAELDDATLPLVVQQFGAENADPYVGVFRSFGVMLVQYDRGEPQAGWPPIADLLLKSTEDDFDSCIRLLFEKYQKDGDSDLLHRTIRLIQDAFPLYRRNASVTIFLDRYLHLEQPENQDRDAQMIDEALGLIDTSSYCFIDTKDRANYGVRHYLLENVGSARSDPSFEARRRRLLSTVAPFLLDELDHLDPQQKPQVVLQVCTMFFEAGDTETAQRVFGDNTKQIEMLAQHKPSIKLVSLYIKLGKYMEAEQRGWVKAMDTVTSAVEKDQLITTLCGQNLADEALRLYLRWYPTSQKRSDRDDDYDFIYRTTNLISELRKVARNDLLVRLFSSMNRETQTMLVSYFFDAGVPATELVSAVKPRLGGSDNFYDAVFGHLMERGDFSAAAEIFRSQQQLLSTQYFTEPPRFCLAKTKVQQMQQELIEATFKLPALPKPPTRTELIATLTTTHHHCTPDQLEELLYQVEYPPFEIQDVITQIFGDDVFESPVPPQMPQTHDRAHLLQRLSGVFTPAECSVIVEKGWDTALLSEAWREGYPNFTESQIENLSLMLSLESKRAGIVQYLNRLFGIHCFTRVPEELWLAMYDDRESDKQWGLVIFSRSDHNNALNQLQSVWNNLHTQIERTHTLVFCEATSLQSIRTSLMRGATQYGKRHGRRKPLEDFKCAFLIIDWHGDESGGTLSHSLNGDVDTETIRKIAQNRFVIAMRNGRIQSNPVPFLSLGCKTGVKFVPEVGEQVMFSESSGPQLPSNTKSIRAGYASDGRKLTSLTPTFQDGVTLTHYNFSE